MNFQAGPWQAAAGAMQAMVPADRRTLQSTESRYQQRANMLNSLVQSKIAKAQSAFAQEDAIWHLQSTGEEVSASVAQLMAEMQALGLNSPVLSTVMGKLSELQGRIASEIKNIGPKEWDKILSGEVKDPQTGETAAIGSQHPIDTLEKYYKGMTEGMSGIVGQRLHLAKVATSLGLPDHAIRFMQKAYADIRYVLDGLISDLGGREPIGKLLEIVGHLTLLKEKVMSQLRITIGSFGGPLLSPEETEALLAKDSDFEDGKDPVAKKILSQFNLIQNKDDLQKFTLSAMIKIAEALPAMLNGVAENLQQLLADPNAGIGSAVMQVKNALTRLELTKGLLRLAIGGENSFKEQAVPSDNLSRYLGRIQELERMADEVFTELENRSFVLSRNGEDPLGDAKDPVLARHMQKKQLEEQNRALQRPDAGQLLRQVAGPQPAQPNPPAPVASATPAPAFQAQPTIAAAPAVIRFSASG